MSYVTELIERFEGRASRIDEKVIAREYATVAEADEATQWAINLRTAARLLRDYIREVPL